MWLKIKKQKVFLIMFLAVMLLGGMFVYLINSSEAYQVKRVIHSGYKFNTTTEIVTVDLEDPTGSGTTPAADTLTGGIDLDPSKSFVVVTQAALGENRSIMDLFGLIDDPTHLVLAHYRANPAVYANYTIVEFASGVNVTSAITTMSETSLIKNITIPSVNLTRAFVLLSAKHYSNLVTADERNLFSASLINSNTLQIRRGTTGGNTGNNADLVYQVIEFDRDANVTNGTFIIPQGGAVSHNQSITVGNLSKAFSVYTVKSGNETKANTTSDYNGTYSTNYMGTEARIMFDGRIVNTSTLQFNRVGVANISADRFYVPWYVVEFANEAFVQSNRTTLAYSATNTTNTASVPIFAVDRTRAFQLVSTSGGNQTGAYYRANHAAQKVAAVLTSDTNLQFMRNTSNASATISSYVVEFPAVDVVSPNGDNGTGDYTAPEIWRVGDTKEIKWNCADAVRNHPMAVKINTENASAIGSYTLFINDTTPVTGSYNGVANNNTYNWTINESIGGTNLIGSQLRIAIIDTNGTYTSAYPQGYFDISNGPFEIKGNLSLGAPLGGENWTVGEDNRSVTWTKKGDLSGSTFRIALSQNGASGPYNDVVTGITQASACSGDACSYDWNPLPDYIGKALRVKVYWAGDSENVTGNSTDNFTIKGKLQLTSPNGGETWYASENKTVTWDKWGNWTHTTHGDNKVNITYNFTAGGGGVVANNVTSGNTSGSYAWVIPTAAIDPLVTVHIESVQDDPDLIVSDDSNATLVINPYISLSYPDAAVVWQVGESHPVNWTLYGAMASVDLWYTFNNVSWTKFADGETGTNQTYSWLVPTGAVNESVTFRAANHTSSTTVPGTPFGDSTITIAIRGTLAVTRPASSDIFRVGATEAINWQAVGFKPADNVRVRFARFGDFGDVANVTTIIGSVSAISNTTSWAGIPDVITQAGAVRVDWVENTSLYDDSDPFNVKGVIDVTGPNGGQAYSVGNTMPITWNATGSLGAVRINYTANNGSDGYQYFINDTWSNTTGNYTYNWLVPASAQLTENIKVQVYQVSDGLRVTDSSTNVLAIRGGLDLTAPDGGEKWQVNTTHQINWTRTGSNMGAVQLKYSTNGGANYNGTISASELAGNGTFTWTVPDVYSDDPTLLYNQMKVRVYYNDYTMDNSTNNFYITPKFTITRPTAISVFSVNDTENITWTTDGSVDKVQLYYSSNGSGGPWTMIDTDPNPYLNNGTYAWYPIPNALSNNTQIKVASYYDNTTAEAQDASPNFRIKGKINLVAPVLNENLTVDYPYLIQWDPHGTIGNFNITYADNGAQFNDTVATNVAGTSVTWPAGVPDKIGTGKKIRVTSTLYDDVYVTSPAFNIVGAILLQTPNGGETYNINVTPMNITWNPHGSIGILNITYDLSSGGDGYTNIINSSVPASNGYYNWNIPVDVTPSRNVKVKVQSTTLSYVNDTSNNTLTILAGISLTAPNPPSVGSALIVGDTYNITWTKYGNVPKFHVYASYNNKGAWSKIGDNITDTFLNWEVPNQIKSSAQLFIRVEDASNSDANSTNTNASAIKGAIQLIQPDGGEHWLKGTTQQIRWKPTGTYPGTVNISYSIDNGGNWTSIATPSVGADNVTQTQNWTIPDFMSTNCLVKVETMTGAPAIDVSDTSNDTFWISGSVSVVQPDGGDLWYVGTNNTIRWYSVGTVTPVKIEYSVDNGGNWTTINNTVTGTDGFNDYNWSVPAALKSDHSLVRVSDNRTQFINDVTDTSAAIFSIRPTLTISQPILNQNVTANTDNTPIRWSYTGSGISRVNVEYSINGGVNWTTIENNVMVENGTSYIWPQVPTLTSTDARVRVYDVEVAKANITASSPKFYIIGNLQLTAPNGGQNYPVGSTQYITWTSAAVSLVNASYSLNNGGLWTPIGQVAAANATIPWPIDNSTQVSTQALVKIEDAFNSDVVYDISAATFNVNAVFNITHPENGDIVIAEDPYNITWTKAGLGVTNVTLEYSVDNGGNWSSVITGGDQTAPNTGTYFWASVPGSTLSTLCKVRIKDFGNANATDTGASVFDLRGQITVTAPTGDDSWQIGQLQNITWTKKGNIPTVDIYYTYNNGTNWTSLASAETASNLSWQWNITPATQTTTQGVIKIADSGNPTIVFDVSEELFEIKGSINLTAPTAPATVLTYDNLSAYNITWTKYGAISNVRIKYSINGGTNYPYIISNSTGASSSPYSWPIPDAIGANLKVNISDIDNPTVYNESANAFAIKGSIHLIQPNGGESLVKGATQQIQWKPTGTYPGNVTLQYSNDSGVSWIDIGSQAAGADNVTQAQNWTVPDDISSGVLVKVSTSVGSALVDVNDTSNATLKIRGSVQVTQPDGGEIWYVTDTNRQIRWYATGTVNPAKIEYSVDNGGNWTVINNTFVGVEGLNIFNWTSIPNSLKSDTCLIRVSDNRTAFVSETTDVSNATFSIRPTLNLTEPILNQNVVANTDNTPIRWTYQGSGISRINVEYSTNGGVNWTTVENNVMVENGTTYVWPQVPTTTSVDARIRIYDVETSKANVTSVSSKFNIIGNLVLTAPNGGQNYPVGSTQYITWTSSAVSLVNASYSLNNGSDWTAIGQVAAANATIPWPIENNTLVSTQALVKIEDAFNPTVVNDVSTATFNVNAVFNITHPENGDIVIAEDPYNITWTKAGLGVSNVTLQYSTDMGGNWTTIVTNGSNTGTYYWSSVPGTVLSTLGKVRIFDTNNANANDTGAGVFDLRGSVTVTDPDGAESWQIGQTNNITWTKKGNILNVDISYSQNNGTNWTSLIAGVAASNLTWPWNISTSTNTTTNGLVKIADSSNPSIVFDTSDAVFEVKGSVGLTAPTAPATVLTYDNLSAYNVTWTKYGGIANVRVKYSINGGTTYPYTIINSTPATNSPVSWTIPDSIGVNLKVNVSDVDNPTVYNESANAFAIKGSMHVVQPNGGQSLTRGTLYEIQWKPTGSYPGTVTLQYSNDSGLSWIDIATPDAGADNITQAYNWTIPNDISSTVLVKVSTSVGNSAIDVNDTSNATLKIKGNVQVTQPDGGETWLVTDTNRQIKWYATGTVTPVKIEYSVDNGGNWSVINDSFTGVEGVNTYNWTPLPDSLKSDHCLIKVTDNRTAFISEVTDVSNATFAIKPTLTITAPALNDNITANSENTTAVRWTYTGTGITKVNIEYSTNGGVNWTTLENNVNVENGSFYVWPQVPTTTSADARIRIYDIETGKANVTATSSRFNIIGNLVLTSPNGGQRFPVGSTQYITWTSAAVSLVNASYSLNNGSSWSDIGQVAAANATIPWPIENNTQVSKTALVRIEDAFNPGAVYDISTATFEVVAVFNITHPENGDIVIAEDPYNITWTKAGLGVSNVTLQYSTDQGENWTAVVTAGDGTVPNTGTYYWAAVPGTTLSEYSKVRVIDPNNEAANNTGAGFFDLRGAITVTAPDGGQSWQIGDIRNITWTKKGNFANVDIYYSQNNGTNWTSLISGVPASNLTWPWNISTSTNTTVQGLVKVADSSNPTIVFDSSNSVFEIKGSIFINQPNDAGIVLTYDNQSATNITWDRYGGIANVKIKYSLNGGTSYPYTIINSTPGGNSPFSWTIPDAIGSTLKVNISDIDNPSVFSASNNSFAIKGAIQLVAPNGGEVWVKGTTQQIKWKPTGTYPGNVLLQYSNDSGSTWTNISQALAGADNVTQIYNWSIPDDLNPTSMVKVLTLVGDPNVDVNDTSNATFKITGQVSVTQPDGGELWYVGDTNRQVTWYATGTVNPVKIEYSVDNGGNWTVLNNTFVGVEGVNTYNWTPIPDTLKSDHCLIKVSDNRTAFTNEVTDTSNATFGIRPIITISEPTLDANITANTENTSAIRWNYTGTAISRVNIEYTSNGGVNWTTVENNVLANNGSFYVWPLVPTLTSADARVKVYDVETGKANVTATSSRFNIVGNLHLTSPNGGQNWPVGTTQYITWTSSAVSLVNASYSLNNGSTWTAIGQVAAANATIPWPIDNATSVSNAAKIKIEDGLNPNVVQSISTNTFAVLPVFNITHPENGDVVIATDPYNIT
ncbi:MAG TPA: hypothetical protein PKL77_03975, partial [Candidatus Omnitrophota bacterium]|nr:hypothetical protein [Candidatus Omnitrophota bacterium]